MTIEAFCGGRSFWVSVYNTLSVPCSLKKEPDLARNVTLCFQGTSSDRQLDPNWKNAVDFSTCFEDVYVLPPCRLFSVFTLTELLQGC